jgi:hypothetical protein
MNVKIIPFDEPSRRAVVCLSFPLLRNGIRLGELLEVATSRGMHHFQFTTIGDDNPMGCRDFMWVYGSILQFPRHWPEIYSTQYCHQIQAAGLVGRTTTDPIDGSQKTLNEIIPFRYSPVTGSPPRRDPSSIDKGIFTSGAYVRVENNDMDYRPWPWERRLVEPQRGKHGNNALQTFVGEIRPRPVEASGAHCITFSFGELPRL